MEYNDFLIKKHKLIYNGGFDIELEKLNSKLMDFQKYIVKWALKKGRCAIFEDTGLGKTIQQLEWAYQVNKYTDKPILILAPLAVAIQTYNEGVKFGIESKVVTDEKEVINGINITNYEKLSHFENIQWGGVVLDESSIIKSYTGKTTQYLIDRFDRTPFKLCCTATPSPNDYTEIGNHSEFLNIMRMKEMLSMYFINDASTGIGWRLKGHCKSNFFEWMATWSIMISSPSDIGFDGSKYILPKLNINTIITENQNIKRDLIGAKIAKTLDERRKARKDSIDIRVTKVKELVNNMNSCLIWCDYNDESTALHKAIENSYEIRGADTDEHKEYSLLGFSDGRVRKLISKPSICGFGMNWQNCNNMIFCGLSDSYEKFYQAIRREYRFGQDKEVNIYIVISQAELRILNNIKEKENKHQVMKREMIKVMSEISISELHNISLLKSEYDATKNVILPNFLNI